jgi:hypothetical protein
MRRFLLSAGATVIIVAGTLAVIALAKSSHWWLILAVAGIAVVFSLGRAMGTPSVRLRKRNRDLSIYSKVPATVGIEQPARLSNEDVELLAARMISGLLDSRSETRRIDAWALARQSLATTVRKGSVAIGGPSRMRQGSTATVEVTVSPDPAAGDALHEALSKYQQVSAETSPVSPVMRVTCDGDGFSVKALSADDQLTVEGATWTFRVRAEQSGQRSLLITLQMRLSSDGTWISRPALSHEVRVSVAPAFVARKLAADNWQWAIGVILGAAGTITAWQKLL